MTQQETASDKFLYYTVPLTAHEKRVIGSSERDLKVDCEKCGKMFDVLKLHTGVCIFCESKDLGGK